MNSMSNLLDRFDEFWAAYPRRVAKLAAQKAYRKALKLTPPEAILKAAKTYAQERLGKDKEFTKHPATWLNSGCWGDYEEIPQDVVSIVGHYATFGSPELDAWNSYGRATKGINYPSDKKGGWYFPTRWPPSLESLPLSSPAHNLENGNQPPAASKAGL